MNRPTSCGLHVVRSQDVCFSVDVMTGPEPPPTTDYLALERTRLALERTMMGWMRTAVSMIGFGFTIFKFFQYWRALVHAPVRPGLLSSRVVALMLVGASTLLLVMATVQYRLALAWFVRHGSRQSFDTVLLGAIVVALIGVVTFIGIALTPLA